VEMLLKKKRFAFNEPGRESGRNPGVHGDGDAVSRHGEDVSRTCHVDLLNKVRVLHDFAKLLDHDVGRVVDLPEEVVDLELLQTSEQVLNPEAPWVGLVVA